MFLNQRIMCSHLHSIRRYLARHALETPEEQELPPPVSELKLCIVIPCLAERENIGQVLDSLKRGCQRLQEVEVIVLVNNSADPAPQVLADNLVTLKDINNRLPDLLRVYGIDRASRGQWFPAAEAGVGLARRVGMDLALRRLLKAGAVDRAAIACLDADSPVAPGYADALLAVFDREDPPLGGICAFAHPLPDDPQMAAAIVAYELWLRYFEAGLQLTGTPFAFSTIGSCTVVSAWGYALADGMPPRQAGEDFHFLRKLVKVSRNRPLARIDTVRVFPVARISQRVLFGTGRAMQRCLSEGLDCYLKVESPQIFFDLQRFFAALPLGFEDLKYLHAALSLRLAAFLQAERAWPVLERIRRNYPSPDQFVSAVHHWFDGLRIVRYAKFYTRATGPVWIFDALIQILAAQERSALVADLSRPCPDKPDLGLQVEWLERMRMWQD